MAERWEFFPTTTRHSRRACSSIFSEFPLRPLRDWRGSRCAPTRPSCPGFCYWDYARKIYRLRFEPAVELVRSGNEEADVRENTARFTRVIEDYIRAHPDQWLWVHKRWKTRPAGEKPVYPF